MSGSLRAAYGREVAALAATPGCGWWALTAAMLREQESLPGALCRSQAPRFDADQLNGESPREHRLRLAGAATICRRCPELVRCPASWSPIR